jgi:hypothetical protein
VLLVIIRDGDKPSLNATKAGFVARLFNDSLGAKPFYVCRNEKGKFKEIWYNDNADLATSPLGIFQYYTSMLLLKSPKEFHDGIVRRLMKNGKSKTETLGSLRKVSYALYQYFGRSARIVDLLAFLRKTDLDKAFIIDGFFSIGTVDLKKLKALGPIIYVSSDLAYDFYGDNKVASHLMLKFEQTAVPLFDLVIACSERDRLKYIELGAKKAIFYPNIYPVADFSPSSKVQNPSVCIVLRSHWGSRAEESLREVFKALSCINRTINVTLIGMSPSQVPKNVRVSHYAYIGTKSEFLTVLSESWVGINLGIHAGGTNERKYDYGMASLVVLSDTLGVRGDLLPHEYAYLDYYDLAAKLDQLFDLGREEINQMGIQNQKSVISLAMGQKEELLKAIHNSNF